MGQALREVDAVSSHAGNGEEMAPFLFVVDLQKQAHLQLTDLFEHQTYYVDITLVGLDEVGSIAAKVSCYCLHARCDKAAEHHLRVKMSVEESGLFKKSILITEEATRRPLLVLSLNAKVKKNNFHLDRKYLIMSSLYPDARHVHFTSDRPGVSLQKAESTDERVRVRILNRDEDGALCEIRTTPSEERPMRGVSSILFTIVEDGAEVRKAFPVHFRDKSLAEVWPSTILLGRIPFNEPFKEEIRIRKDSGVNVHLPESDRFEFHEFLRDDGTMCILVEGEPTQKGRIREEVVLRFDDASAGRSEVQVVNIRGVAY